MVGKGLTNFKARVMISIIHVHVAYGIEEIFINSVTIMHRSLHLLGSS